MTSVDTKDLNRVPVPRKLNKGIITALAEVVRKGNYMVTACRLCKVDEGTITRWLTLGEADIVAGRDSLYTALYVALKEAEAEAEALMVQTARDAAISKRDGYLAITFMERRHPDRWGKRERKTIDIREHKVIEVIYSEVIKDYGPEGHIETSTRKLLDNNTT